jgi:putative Mg2+ transporter-C (MgtC) family protein
MTCGAGLYLTAVFATVLILLALEAVGALETLTNLKLLAQTYEVRGNDAELLYRGVLDAMDKEQRRLEQVERDTVGTLTRLSFNVMATRRGHRRLTALLTHEPRIDRVLTFRTWEED